MKQQILEKQVAQLEEQNAQLAGRVLVSREISTYLMRFLRETTPEDVFEQLMEDAEAHSLSRFADILVEEAAAQAEQEEDQNERPDVAHAC